MDMTAEKLAAFQSVRDGVICELTSRSMDASWTILSI